MKLTVGFFLIGLFLLGTGCSASLKNQKPPLPLMVSAEEPVPGVPSEVTSPQYWITANRNPDQLIMSADDIDYFNEGLREKSIVVDVTEFRDEIPGDIFRNFLAANARQLAEGQYYVTGDIPLENNECRSIIARMDTLSVPETIPLRFGMTLYHVMGRVWPTDILLMNQPNDNEFDQGVTARVDMATPVALIHQSPDGLWLFVQTPWFPCWLPAQSVAFGDRETVRSFVKPATPAVAKADEVTIFAAPDAPVALGSIRMGDYLPLNTAGADFYQVSIPVRSQDGLLAVGSGYIRKDAEISIDFLPYTFRNVYQQAFALLGTRYGWGGMNGNRDCSFFILSIFRCFNIQLPWNSLSQVNAAPALLPMESMDTDTRLDTLSGIPGGITLLGLDGHIMLYLGEFLGKPYAIHAFWAWRQPNGKNLPDTIHRVARVAVTDLMLGNGSEKGSFLDRLTHLGIIGNYEIH